MIEAQIALIGKPTMQDDVGGGRWMIVFGSFFVQFIVCGITYSLGIFQIIFQDVFSKNHFDTSWAGAILIYVTALTSKLHNLCGIRALDKGRFACS